MSLTFTDVFCGAGGSSIGLSAAGFELRLAANHWERAIETHSANFPDAEHVCADVNNYDMRRLPTTDIGWFSPICTEVSPAGGNGSRRRRQLPGQGDLLEAFGPISQKGYERTRATFHDVIRATEVHRYLAVLVENVPEVASRWELFDWWCDGMRQLGYNLQFVSVSSAHVGGVGNPHAPQWRDRLYLVFTRKDIPRPDVDPRPLARCELCGLDVAAAQAWKPAALRRTGGRKIGKYRQQYVYVCPNSACKGVQVEPYVLPAAAAIDWSDVGTRIGDRSKPLAEATLTRIRTGLEMFARPTMLTVNHSGHDGRPRPADGAPLPTQTVRIGDGIAMPEPFITVLRNHADVHGLDEPLRTMAASGHHHGLAVPHGAFYVKHYGGFADPKHMAKDVATTPFGTVTTADHHSLVIPYRRGNRPTTTAAPLHTMSTVDSAAVVRPSLAVEDCYFRMLLPREQLRAQRFPDSYVVTGNVGEQTMQAGNAVSANVAQWLGTVVANVLGGER